MLAVGDGKVLDNGTRQKIGVKEGDTILFTSYAGSDVELDGKPYLIVAEQDVLGIVR